MAAVTSTLAGSLRLTLVVTLPAMVVDDVVDAVLDEITRKLPNAEGAALVLDCAEVELMNSMGITCLLQAQDYCKRRGAPMVMAAVPPSLATFLKQLRLDTRFPRMDSVDEAVARFDPAN